MKKIVLHFIYSYQKFFSSEIRHNMFFASSCRFIPSCSEYTYQAVDKYGTIRGLLYGFKRILRCHPFSKGGYNPV